MSLQIIMSLGLPVAVFTAQMREIGVRKGLRREHRGEREMLEGILITPLITCFVKARFHCTAGAWP